MSSAPLRVRTAGALVGTVLLIAACGGEKRGAPPAGAPESAAAPSAAATNALSTTPLTPAAGHKVIVVELITDATGSYFKPNKIEAKHGDVVRFTLGAGVHNVHFFPDSNPGKQGLPPASDLLQLPGQTLDLPVSTLAPGKYYFQCDPHALLGMRGHLEVES